MTLKKLRPAAGKPRTQAAPPALPSTSEPLATPTVVVEQAVAEVDFSLLPIVHTILYGDSGTGKSSMAATYPKAPGRPMLVMGFDPPGKFSPYREVARKLGGKIVPISTYDPGGAQWYTDTLTLKDHAGNVLAGPPPVECILDADGREVVRIENYIDPNPEIPRAADQIERRLLGFENEAANWLTVVLDSLTFYDYASLRRVKARLGLDMFAKGTDTRQWYAIAKADHERIIKSQMAWLTQTNVVAIYHTGEDKSEFASDILRGILTIGKLNKELPPGFDEIHRTYVKRDSTGQQAHFTQTKHDGVWVATSITCHAPDPCVPNYNALWANYLKMYQQQ